MSDQEVEPYRVARRDDPLWGRDDDPYGLARRREGDSDSANMFVAEGAAIDPDGYPLFLRPVHLWS